MPDPGPATADGPSEHEAPEDAPATEAQPAPAAPGRAPEGLLPALAAGLMLVAGMLHLFLVDVHMAHARGVGLFFLVTGAAQAVWAVLYLRHPHPVLARVGLAALAVAPTVLYLLTRVARAPWASGPEAVDAFGVATLVAQIGAGLALVAASRPSQTARRVAPQAVAVGLLLAVGGYGGALAAEDVPWLASAEELHSHLAGHGDHGEHDGHGTDVIGIRGTNLVGSTNYYGPATGAALDQQCRQAGAANEDCWLYFLQDKLVADGSVAAFDLLKELMAVNADADHGSHALAHVLGKAAYQAYGLDIQLTLKECSYEVFQGCLHGALQGYFADLASLGDTINGATIQVPCAGSETRFATYACIHGIGHGVMIHTNYALHEALDVCALFPTHFERSSCWGGVFMENVVAYLDSTKPDYVPHNHGAGPPTFWVDADEPAYPCNEVKRAYERDCWRMQTSLILHFNGGDFEAASAVCDTAGTARLDCYNSLGRDAAPYAKRDPLRMSQMCSHGADDARAVCVKAFTSGIILQANDPTAGLQLCLELPDRDKAPCYEDTGRQAASFHGANGSADFCDLAPEAYHDACERGRT